MASKSKLAQKKQATSAKKINFYLIGIPVFAFFIKLIIMANIKGTDGGVLGGWLGADGENYLSGVDGLLQQGYFSDKSILSYWPAGYPILIWILTKISLAHVIYLIAFTQTIFYAYASYYFVKQLRGTRLQPYMFLIGLALAFNPTLSLSSLAVGYESPIAACMLMVVGLIMKSRQSGHDRQFVLRVLSVGFFSALASFMQPRWILTSLVIAAFWALITKGRKAQALILVGVIGVMTLAPAIMMQRNIKSIDKAVISTNLGVTMAIGAGDETKGGYVRTGPEVPCSPKVPGAAVTDNDKVKCVLKWYLTNPLKTGKLAFYKSEFFWSPWSGPLANGTMARNPWLKISPTKDLQNSQSGARLVKGNFGKLISWLWIICQIGFLFYGFMALRKIDPITKVLANTSMAAVVISWLISIGTIGDNRFRIPTMSLSLLLQVAAIWKMKQKVSKAL